MRSSASSPAEIGHQTPFLLERRQHTRRRLPCPAFATVNASSGQQRVVRCRILDLSEYGMSVEDGAAAEPGSQREFCLELSETEGFVSIVGEMIWRDPAGNAGVCFVNLPEALRHALQQWLRDNATVARPDEPRLENLNRQPKGSAGLSNALLMEGDCDSPPPDHTTLLIALAAVRREVESLGGDLDASLQLIARRAQTFTRATGTAIAITEGQDMVCRAVAGEATPPLGAMFRTGSGFSGECASTGELLRCDDSEVDARVDGAACRALGIRSLLAAPVRLENVVVGLVEVFARKATAFRPDDEVALLHLSEFISAALGRSARSANSPILLTAGVDDEFPVETPAALPFRQLYRSRDMGWIGAVVAILAVIGWLLGSTGLGGGAADNRSSSEPRSLQTTSAVKPSPANDVQTLISLAEHGDSTAEAALGLRYAVGQDVPQDYTAAFRWFSEAAQRGSVTAQATLSSYYELGRGVLPDLVQAYYWALLAQAGGDDASKARVLALGTRLAPSRAADAQQQANAWIRQHPRVGATSTRPNN